MVDKQWFKGHPILLRVGNDGKLPTEFRIFRPGINDSTKGEVLFDDAAAEQVMSAYREHGVEVMIDLEHLSVAAEDVTGDARNHDPDARGWCQLEVRNGELWAVGVTWTEDGADRLRKRKQRYISPAFFTDDNGRVVDVFNVAITATPATHGAQPLVASAKGNASMKPEDLGKLIALVRSGSTLKDALKTLAIDLKELQKVVTAMGFDPSNIEMEKLQQIVAAMGAAEAAEAMPAEEMPAEAMADTPPKEDEPAAQARAMSRVFAVTGKATEAEAVAEITRLKKSAIESEKLAKLHSQERAALEAGERRQLVVELVKLGRETPATAWVDSDGITPRGSLGTMPITELKTKVELFGGSPVKAGQAAPTPPGTSSVEAADGVEVSEFEMKRLEVMAKKKGCDFSVAKERYLEIRSQQVLGARGRMINKLGRSILQGHVLGNEAGKIHREYQRNMWTTAVKPIEQFESVSQRAMEEFRLEYMVNMAVVPPDWVDQFGDLLPSGALSETFPLDFSTVSFAQRLGQGVAAETPQNAEIPVKKEEYLASKMGNADRIRRGDFAYLRTWIQGGAQFSRGRWKLRSDLVKTLLEANGTWAVSPKFPSGLDAKAFFAADHLVNPFKGTDTFSNYQASPTPLNSANLDAELQSVMLVPAFDGVYLGEPATDIIHPVSLHRTAYNLLSVQDLILSGVLAGDGDGTMGTVRSPHAGQGLRQVQVPQLTGTDNTADYYLASQGIIDMGFSPWVVSEDAAEEVLEYDEDSDYYKDTGNLKVTVKIHINAALVWPHGLRLVKGS